MTIVVTGASGHLGRLVIGFLLDKGVSPEEIVAGARDTAKIADLGERGVTTVILDYEKPDSIAAALQGADKVLLISGNELGKRVDQHTAVVDAAMAASVQLLAYTSATRATNTALLLAPEHKATEEAIVASDVPYTMLRNCLYTESDRVIGAARRAAATGVIANCVGEVRVVRSASRADLAEAAAVVLTEPGHEGKVYELSGDEVWGYPDLAAVAGEVFGREIVYQTLTEDEQRARLKAAGVPDFVIDLAVGVDINVRDGIFGIDSGDLSRLIGHPTRTLAQVAQSELVQTGP